MSVSISMQWSDMFKLRICLMLLEMLELFVGACFKVMECIKRCSFNISFCGVDDKGHAF